jgi:hypothetical protein
MGEDGDDDTVVVDVGCVDEVGVPGLAAAAAVAMVLEFAKTS